MNMPCTLSCLFPLAIKEPIAVRAKIILSVAAGGEVRGVIEAKIEEEETRI
jgi:hypothetical protein